MRVLVICPSFPPAADGEGEHCFQIAERLSARGHQVQVLTQRRVGLVAGKRFETLAVMDGWMWRALPRFIGVLVRCQADAFVLIYTARLYDEHPMVTFLPTWRNWFVPRSRVVSLIEIARPPDSRHWRVRLIRKFLASIVGGHVDYGYGTLLRGSDCVAVLGPSILGDLTLRDPTVADRSVVLPPPPLIAPPLRFTADQRQQVRTRLGVSEGDVLVGYFGYVYPGKGVDTLIASLRQLLSAGVSARVLMAGGGRGDPSTSDYNAFEASMQQLARDIGVADKILWQAGYVSGSEAVAQLLACDLAVLPFDDGAELRRSSIAVVAALGLPLITTTPSIAETAFQHLHNCWLIAPKDPAALGEAIRFLAQDGALRAQLSAGALELAGQWFSWNLVVEGIEAAIASEGIPKP